MLCCVILGGREEERERTHMNEGFKCTCMFKRQTDNIDFH